MFDIYLVNRCMNEKLSYHTFCVGMDRGKRTWERSGIQGVENGIRWIREKRGSKHWDIRGGGGGDLIDFRLRKKEEGNSVSGREVGVGVMKWKSGSPCPPPQIVDTQANALLNRVSF